MSGMPRLLGISHIDLTVSDCDRSATWWRDVMGFTPVNHVSQPTYECRSLIHPSGVAVTVMTHDATAAAGPFDERRVGLDHLAFQITDPAEPAFWVSQIGVEGERYAYPPGWGVPGFFEAWHDGVEVVRGVFAEQLAAWYPGERRPADPGAAADNRV